MTRFARRFLLCGVAYVLAGMILGIFMGATQDFTFVAAHAHINLLGWVTMGLFAYYYNTVPQAGETRLAQVHFWTSQAGLLLIIPGLTIVIDGDESGEPLLITGELLTILSMLLFAFTVYRNKPA